MSPITRSRKPRKSAADAISAGRAKPRPAGFVFGAIAAVLALIAQPDCARAGDSAQRIVVGGVARRYTLHVPSSLPKGALAALVIVLHGGGGSGASAAEQTGFSAEADARGFIVAYPEGSDRKRPLLNAIGKPGFETWNAGACCGYAMQQGMDDVGFIRAMVAAIRKDLPIDPRRIYATGISNGGMMAYRLACDASDLVAAVGIVSGVSVAAPCAPWYPVSVIALHGTADENVPIAGGVGRKSLTQTSYPPVAGTIAFWAAHDDCGRTPIESTPAPGVTLRDYPLCIGNTAVAYYVIAGGGHSWPGGRRMAAFLDPPSTAIAATPLIWGFFAEHGKQ